MRWELSAEQLQRGAIVYVRQSTPHQVLHHRESQQQQYALEQLARDLGFQQVAVIDEDLGRSASGFAERSGFERLLTAVVAASVGAIFCVEASRLARNGREWHTLIELCGWTRTVIVDPASVYDPAVVNDRLLLGLKGTMSEFEWNLLRQRSSAAIRQKAQRGALQFALPVGYLWTLDGRIDKDPDERVQQAVEMVFAKMTELGSVRQVLLWFRRQGINLPRKNPGGGSILWTAPTYSALLNQFCNPLYGGAYAFGRTESQTRLREGRARKSTGHKKPQEQWTVLILDHHPGYISWEQYQRNQATMAANAHIKSQAQPKAGRGGQALLSGVLRCRRCGRMLYVCYRGSRSQAVRYRCQEAHRHPAATRCITVSGVCVDRVVSAEVLRAVGGNAVEAAVEAAERKRQQEREEQRAQELELEQARYQARLAERRYEQVDPEQRLVARELEARWEAAMRKVQALEERVRHSAESGRASAIPDKEILMSLAQDLPAVWNAPQTDAGLKQRIVRILIREVVVDVDEAKQEIVVLIHWAGGRHSELRVAKRAPGQHGRSTAIETIEVVRRMAGRFGDGEIAATLNRLRMRTGGGHGWNAQRVYMLRHQHGLPKQTDQTTASTLTLQQAVEQLGVSELTVRRLIERKVLPATQVVPCAPWEIPREALLFPAVQQAIASAGKRSRPSKHFGGDSGLLFSET